MAFLNNLLELRSDAFKMTVHNRRPIPSRTDTIGPWLDALTFLSWLGALTNSALVYLFSPELLPSPVSFSNVNVGTATFEANVSQALNNSKLAVEEHLVMASGGLVPSSPSWGVDGSTSSATLSATKELLLKAVLVSLVASHGFVLVRLLIRHMVERVFWRGSREVEEREREDREVKMQFLKGNVAKRGTPKFVGEVLIEKEVGGELVDSDGATDSMEFWDHDEGVEEIQRISKEA